MQNLMVSQKAHELITLWNSAPTEHRVLLMSLFILGLTCWIAALIYCTPRRSEAKNLDLKYLIKKL